MRGGGATYTQRIVHIRSTHSFPVENGFSCHSNSGALVRMGDTHTHAGGGAQSILNAWGDARTGNHDNQPFSNLSLRRFENYMLIHTQQVCAISYWFENGFSCHSNSGVLV